MRQLRETENKINTTKYMDKTRQETKLNEKKARCFGRVTISCSTCGTRHERLWLNFIHLENPTVTRSIDKIKNFECHDWVMKQTLDMC